MSDRPQNEYLRAKIMTASPEQLQTMLYDGAIRFAEQGRAAMEARDIPATHDRLIRAQNIVLELSTSLKVEAAPELCSKLASLYNYVYRLLVEANLTKEIAKVDEALGLLRYQRETWLMALETLRRSAAPTATLPAAAQAPPKTYPPAAGPAAKAYPAAGTAALKAPLPQKSQPGASPAPAAGKPASGRILSIEG